MTTIVRWIGATAMLLCAAWVGTRWGHGAALAVLVGLLVIVTVFGGHGRARRGPDADAGPDGDAVRDRDTTRHSVAERDGDAAAGQNGDVAQDGAAAQTRLAPPGGDA